MSRLKNMDIGKMEILIVEDSPTQALVLQQLLEKNGYKISVAGNGLEALAFLLKHTPNMIISDVVMPEMDGYELCRKIKSHDQMKKIPVLLLTTLSDPEEIFRGLKNGADNFVIKPYDEKLLLSRIRHIFINQEMRSRQRTDIGIDIFLGGKRHYINSDRIQILDLLVSTYEHSLKQKRELERINRELKEALETVKTLEGILPICSGC